MHVPVLSRSVLDYLNVREDGVYVDCTAGAGGHSALIAEGMKRGRLIALDRDLTAVRLAEKRLAAYAFVTVLQANYCDLRSVLEGSKVRDVDGVLIDAGVSSMQLDDPGRGFSFQEDGPLDMRMDASQGPTALELLTGRSETELMTLLRDYGDVRKPKRLAAAIRQRCDSGGLATTKDLVQLVRDVFKVESGTPDVVRNVFQAIRIAVNEELRCLDAGVRQAVEVLAPEGRLVCLSFHSGEDRIIKKVFREYSRPRQELEADGRVRGVVAPVLKVLTRSPVTPSAEEIRENSRAQSAKLRAAERLAPEGAAA